MKKSNKKSFSAFAEQNGINAQESVLTLVVKGNVAVMGGDGTNPPPVG